MSQGKKKEREAIDNHGFSDGKGEVSLPAAARQFLAAFNRGAYPELEIQDIKPPEPN